MTQSLTAREFDCLKPASQGGELSDAAYRFLRDRALAGSDSELPFLKLTARGGREVLQLQNYVGVVSAPDGTVIEILPKHTPPGGGAAELANSQRPGEPAQSQPEPASGGGDQVADSRRLLWKMLRRVHDIPWRQATEAALDTYRKPLPELLVARFLDSLSQLVRRGMRSDYQRQRDCRPFLKGCLDVSRQLRLPPGRAADFCIEFDAYTANRPENRLISAALDRLRLWQLSVTNDRQARVLSFAFAGIDASANINADFARWAQRRDMAHYQPVKPWLELILKDQSPWLFSGGWRDISMLFPMERLFESYLGRVLDGYRIPGYELKSQVKTECLAVQGGNRMFRLRPDWLVTGRNGARHSLLDAKWKLLNVGESKNCGLVSSDLYQLFAYGHKYLDGRGDMLLVFPRHPGFAAPLPPFEFGGGLRLWILPFDLDRDVLCCPPGLELPWLAEPAVTAAA